MRGADQERRVGHRVATVVVDDADGDEVVGRAIALAAAASRRSWAVRLRPKTWKQRSGAAVSLAFRLPPKRPACA